MSARRRYGLLAAVLCATLLSGACRIGQNPALSPSATSPRGIVVSLDWQPRARGRLEEQGELLGANVRGVYLVHPGGVLLYPFGTPVVLRPDRRPPSALDLRTEDGAALMEFVQYARYPFGLDAATLDRVLDAMGVDSVVVRSRP
jgi:hypothetical protein